MIHLEEIVTGLCASEERPSPWDLVFSILDHKIKRLDEQINEITPQIVQGQKYLSELEGHLRETRTAREQVMRFIIELMIPVRHEAAPTTQLMKNT